MGVGIGGGAGFNFGHETGVTLLAQIVIERILRVGEQIEIEGLILSRRVDGQFRDGCRGELGRNFRRPSRKIGCAGGRHGSR